MTLVVGIDEAGYGPTLGPLVVAAAVFRVREPLRSNERRLDRLVTMKRQPLALPIRDSKQIYRGASALARLEATTLGSIAMARGHLPLRTGALLEHAIDFEAEDLVGYPWYGDRGDRLLARPLPAQADVGTIAEGVAHDREQFAERGAELADIVIAPVPVHRFNQLSTAANSKAYALFFATGRLIQTLAERYPAEDVVIHVDRHGGRTHYGNLLQTFFPLSPLATRRETRRESAYELAWPGRSPLRVDFRIQADGRRTPVALASMVAKTTRELFMACLNDWFAERVPELQPTAGYPVDSHRFLAEVAPVLAGESVDEMRLVRCR